jgi:hypothetical protein
MTIEVDVYGGMGQVNRRPGRIGHSPETPAKIKLMRLQHGWAFKNV